MIVVAAEDSGQLGVGVLRGPSLDVAVAAADIENARGGQLLLGDGVEKFAESMQMGAGVRIVGHVSEVLRRVVVGHVAGMRSISRGIVDLVVVSLLIPAPVDGVYAMA